MSSPPPVMVPSRSLAPKWRAVTDLRRQNLDVITSRHRWRNLGACLSKVFQVKFYSLLNKLFDLGFGFAYRDTARKIRNICPPTCFTFLYNDHVSHIYFFSPACFRTLLRVPGGMSILSFPAVASI